MAMPSPVSLETQAAQELAYAAGCRAAAASAVFEDGSTDYEEEDYLLSQATYSERIAAELRAEAEEIYTEIEERFDRRDRKARR